ncbi:MAG TPA: VOC family protein [Solirubrobacterales bacterium]|jgi:predicted enzyme related to lactoylglutathione lyase|nr:VOC family protein [Solirubrobacterales bacterium]
MGQPVTHFEVIGKDGEKLRSYYGELFGWRIDANNPMNYGLVGREDNLSPEGIGIGGGIGQGPGGYQGHVTFYVGVDDVEATLAKAESLGGTRLMGPDEMDTPGGRIVLGHLADPEGHLIGVVHPVM